MNTLIKSNLKNKNTKFILQNITFFKSFDSVYLFGSTLNQNAIPKDIDLLLIYSKLSHEMINETKQIRSVLEEKLNMPVDLTVLSLDELKTTAFLKKIINYLKLK
ncbi:MAG TPA: nucleotidyltransferase domain-containing protein [Clostridia bacterium]|nr:nucleotidyltransferase domain-containing protein [Clostridia bacterium]